MPETDLMVGFRFQERGSFGTYVLLPIKPKEDTPAHNKKAESERSELSLSKEDTPAHNKRAESKRSELSLNYERERANRALSLSQLRVLLSSAKKTNLHTTRE